MTWTFMILLMHLDWNAECVPERQPLLHEKSLLLGEFSECG